jgi:hypothetical protein
MIHKSQSLIHLDSNVKLFCNIELSFHTSFGFAINLFAISHMWKSWTSQQHNWYNRIFWNDIIQKIGRLHWKFHPIFLCFITKWNKNNWMFVLKIPCNFFVFYDQMKQKQLDVCIENSIQFFILIFLPNETKTIGWNLQY